MIVRFACESTRSPGATDSVRPADLRRLSAGSAAERADVSGGAYMPYCLDLRRGTAIYTRVGSADEVMAAPFAYQHQRASAAEMLEIEWDALPLHPPSEAQPVFVFSPGRCGSTLFHAILRSGAALSVSEPDFYTQIEYARYDAGLPLATRDELFRLTEALTEDLCALLSSDGRAVFVKLRSECCFDPALILSGLESPARTVFLVRDFEPWAASLLRVFGSSPELAVQTLAQAIACAAWLKRNTDCRLVRYEELTGPPAHAAALLSERLGLAIDAEAVSRATATHSQAGTRLQPGPVAGVGDIATRLAEAKRLWRAVAPREQLAFLGLSDLAAE